MGTVAFPKTTGDSLISFGLEPGLTFLN